MVTFTRSEIISATQLVRQFSSLLNGLLNNQISKIGIVRNNEMEAVVIPVDEYERLTELAKKAERKTVSDFFGTMDDETFEQMEMAIKDCRKVDLNEW